MNTPLTVLFLCTGNSCRSIIGEGLANHLGQGRLRALSAGSHPTGQVNPGALAVLSRHGIEMAHPLSKSMDDLEGEAVDLVITVCDAAAGESCPVWLGNTAKVHWGLPDPAHVTGDDDTIAAAFEATYQQLRARIENLMTLDIPELTVLGLTASAQSIHRQLDDI